MSDALRLIPPDKDGYTVAEAAVHFKVTPRAVRRYIERGQLTAERIRSAKGTEWRILSLDLQRIAGDSSARAEPDHGQPPRIEDDRDDTEESDASPRPSEVVLKAMEMIAERDHKISELEEARFQLAGQLGFLQAQLQNAHATILLLEGPKSAEPPPPRHWWQVWRR